MLKNKAIMTHYILVYLRTIKPGTLEDVRSDWPIGYIFNHGKQRNEQYARTEFKLGPADGVWFEPIYNYEHLAIMKLMKDRNIDFVSAFKIINPNG